ncbi:MAG: dihydrodipicolinate synthase family protein [Deltaproteobacteria bacterium]|jgi:4-hydroxy-tetrahydrodipicolinate synthase|nr:dihydrodipicolinate synthase family protein [Deltaproteobacteria bacterium]
MKSKFLSPAVSIFDKKGRPDREENLRLYEHLKNGGISGIVIMGSTGEFYSLSMKECKTMIDIASGFPKGSMEIFAGTSRMKVDESIELSNYAYEKGLDGVMIISPYYAPLTQDNIFDLYSSIASETKARIFIYNYPARTAYSVDPGTVLKLAEKFENIKGVKDTILEMGHTSDLIKEVKSRIPDFEIYSGYDNNFAHNILSGGNGCIGALSNIAPGCFANWMSAIDSGDLKGVAAYQRDVDKMMDVYNIGASFIPVIKKALYLMGIINSEVSMEPIRPANEEMAEKVNAILTKMGLKTVVERHATE